MSEREATIAKLKVKLERATSDQAALQSSTTGKQQELATRLEALSRELDDQIRACDKITGGTSYHKQRLCCHVPAIRRMVEGH